MAIDGYGNGKVDPGARPDAETITNDKGGLQSKLAGRYDLIPGEALTRVAAVFGYGAQKYAVNNWRAIDYHEHINHAAMHLAAILADDDADDHLGHLLCRVMMAVATEDTEHEFTNIHTGPADKFETITSISDGTRLKP